VAPAVLVDPADDPASVVLADPVDDLALARDLDSADLARVERLDCYLQEVAKLLRDVRLDVRHSVVEAPDSATRRPKKAQ